jgi:hypothetical protein
VIVRVRLWQSVQLAPAEALGAVANQKEIARAVASMMPADVEIELDRLMISLSFFILKMGLIYAFYEI